MKRTVFLSAIVLLILALQGAFVCADVDFDDFSISIDNDDIDTGDSFEVELLFEGPDNTEKVDVEIEIQIDGTTVFLDEDYAVSFTEDEDKTITISSDDFPGPDLDSDYFNDNLMNYMCDDYTVKVFIRGKDLEDEYDDKADLTIGDDAEELDVKVKPSSPEIDDDVTVSVEDEDGDEFEGVTVKVTWIDDPDGDEDGEWDSEDDTWDDTTDKDGEAEFNIEDDFDDDAEGEFQIDVYKDGYCLERKTISVAGGELVVSVNPRSVVSGNPVSICVEDQNGDEVVTASLYIYGPSYSQTHRTGSDGCVSLTLESEGTYRISASKSGYDTSVDNTLTVTRSTTTTSRTTTTSTTTTTTTTTTTSTTLKILEKLTVEVPKKTLDAGEKITVSVKDMQGQPVEGVTVTVSPAGKMGKTDASGEFSFTLYDEGTYVIQAQGDQRYEGFKETIEVLAKETGGEEEPEASGGQDWTLLALALIVLLVVAVVFASLLTKKKPGEPEKKEASLFDTKKH